MVRESELITGIAVRGDGRGRLLGFPTANLKLDDESQRPADGVYACRVKLEEKLYKGALHVGPRPTFAGAVPTVEVHILDFPDRDLYDTMISFQPAVRLRDIMKFASADELQEALARDCAMAASALR